MIVKNSQSDSLSNANIDKTCEDANISVTDNISLKFITNIIYSNSNVMSEILQSIEQSNVKI